jgi:hypothetical protein
MPIRAQPRPPCRAIGALSTALNHAVQLVAKGSATLKSTTFVNLRNGGKELAEEKPIWHTLVARSLAA